MIGDPDSKRLAMLLPMEGDRWILSLGGLNGESAPTDDAGMLANARSLRSSVIADVLATAEPLTDPVTYRRVPANERRRVERLRRFPLGWVLASGPPAAPWRCPGRSRWGATSYRVNTASQHDDAVVIRFNEVLALLRRPESLLTPAFVLRVLRAARRGPGTLAGRSSSAGGAAVPRTVPSTRRPSTSRRLGGGH